MAQQQTHLQRHARGKGPFVRPADQETRDRRQLARPGTTVGLRLASRWLVGYRRNAVEEGAKVQGRQVEHLRGLVSSVKDFDKRWA